jgi:UDP:flavonoid glycosyltransferase YjiC (YdhE family)
MPFCWDGLDNAARIHDTGYGEQLPRYQWTESQLAECIARLLVDQLLQKRLHSLSTHMQTEAGSVKAARILAGIASTGSFQP